ncbi:MAG: hypothetical protein FWH08_02240 [Oscillospiraceae bacterium]|nr:hypothetical protein [Oscillospiraceae bacterium]
MNSSKSAFIATIVVFLLAVTAAIFAFLLIGKDKDEGSDAAHRNYHSNYRPSDELEDEMLDAAERLIRNNHDIIGIYVTRGLPVKPEPYGNRPENNTYYVDSEEFKTLEELESFVDKTFIPEEAERVKNNMLDDGSDYYSNFGRIYFDKNGQLGINADFAEFVPYDEFPVNWNNPSYSLKALSATEAALVVQLSISDVDVIFERIMYKQDGEWLLDQLILDE